MITMKELEAPIRQWVPDWLGLVSIFVVILPVTMLNGSYTGSMLEVSEYTRYEFGRYNNGDIMPLRQAWLSRIPLFLKSWLPFP